MNSKIVGVAALAATLALTGCAQTAGTGTTNQQGSSSVDSTDLDEGFDERTIRLSDGRTITCLTWVEYDYYNETKASGLDCDWGEPE